jgi:alkylation response protein AidB-like acyl-CoA dehydrogenase
MRVSQPPPNLSSIERLPVDQIARNADKVDKDAAFPNENITALATSGFLGLIVPKANGGHEASNSDYAAVVEEIGAACASTGMIFVMHCCAIEAIKTHMVSDTASQILSVAAKGQHLSTLALSERGTGVHFYATYGTSQLKDKGYLVNVEKCFATSGGKANSYVVSARAVKSEDPLKSTLYLVFPEDAGVSFNGQWNGLGMRGNCSIDLSVKNAIIPSNRLIGEAAKGLDIELSSVLPRFLLGSSSVYLGIAKAAYEAACLHVKSRAYQHSGQALQALAVVQRSIGEMKSSVDLARTFNRSVAKQWDEEGQPPLIALMEAKLLSCKTASAVTSLAMQLCGGIAYSGALPVERHMRDALAGSVMAPTTDMLLELIGKAALGLPLL